ncbi:glycosyltransferase family 4 protein [Gelatiniphilus marinus]|uniref:Glycosyltransferase family 4 protein n=1 Tax=Gelatiniphilus marinus TaxID=1759464 RepID=A0ABW5JVK3_9FLAO
MKDILIITSYYPPETGAASNRIFHLANGLKKHNFNVSVITPLPNYPTGAIFTGYKGKFKHITTEKGINIFRLWIYASNSKNKLLRLFAMLSYSFSLIWVFTWNKIPKTVIIQSPPLIVAYTAVFFLRSKQRKLILNVSDLWPIAGLELGALKKNFSYKILERIERFNYKNADLILGQSEEIITHVKSFFPKKNTFLYRNYPDFKPLEIIHKIKSKKKLTIVYAGLLGVAQGIYKLLQHLDYTNIEFHIYGNGAEQYKIISFVKNNPNLPVFYHGEITREELHSALLQYDVTVIPLLNRIYGSVPSKIFEYARLGLPIIYFGGGEGESIIKANALGWIATAGNYNDLNKVIAKIKPFEMDIELKQKIKETALKNFDFNTQLSNLIEKI